MLSEPAATKHLASSELTAFDPLTPSPEPRALEQAPVHLGRLLGRALPREGARPGAAALDQVLALDGIVVQLLERLDVRGRIAPFHDHHRGAAYFFQATPPRGHHRRPRRERLHH